MGVMCLMEIGFGMSLILCISLKIVGFLMKVLGVVNLVGLICSLPIGDGKPQHCNLPRFEAKVMLEKLRDKRLVFVGDLIGRNQWESLLCLLSSAVKNESLVYEVNGSPITKHRGFLVFKFEDYNCTVEYYRSPFLVPQGRPPTGSPEKVKTTLKLDTMERCRCVTVQYWALVEPRENYQIVRSFLVNHMSDFFVGMTKRRLSKLTGDVTFKKTAYPKQRMATVSSEENVNAVSETMENYVAEMRLDKTDKELEKHRKNWQSWKQKKKKNILRLQPYCESQASVFVPQKKKRISHFVPQKPSSGRTTLALENFPYHLSDEIYVRTLFSRFGNVVHVGTIYDGTSGRGVAFVGYDTRAEAESAVEGINGKICNGNELKVTYMMDYKWKIV